MALDAIIHRGDWTGDHSRPDELDCLYPLPEQVREVFEVAYRYQVLPFQPRVGAPSLYMAAAPASEITQWADAPHKQIGIKAGYQRELDEGRAANIKKYLELDTANILPSAALIAVREEAYRIEEDDHGHTYIVISDPSADDHARRAVVTEDFRRRLSTTELASVVIEDGREESNIEDDADVVPPESYLASLYQELLNYDIATPARRIELDELVVTFSLPGLIIDGQHRIFGAKEAAELNVRMPIVFLPGAAISEQVFQFYVLNNKAKPLDKRQLRAIIATSLSKQEIESLYDRFRVSGLRADEAQWTHRVGSDVESPFRGLVSLRLKGDDAPVDDNVMDQVVSRFIKLPRTYNLLKKGIDWEKGDPSFDNRLGLFYAMWNAIKDTYPLAWEAAAARENGAQFFQKVSLLQLQEFILKKLKFAVQYNGVSPLETSSGLYESVLKVINVLPEQFFLKEWKRKGLDTFQGRQFFLDQMERVAEGEGTFLGNYGLFKESQEQ